MLLKLMKKIFFFILGFTTISIQANDYISVWGVNLAMSAEEIIEVAELKSYKCFMTQGEAIYAGDRGYCCSKKMCRNLNSMSHRGISFIFKKGTEVVDKILISCQATNSCKLEMREIKNILINEQIVAEMEYEVVRNIDINLGQYRAVGPMSDQLVINPLFAYLGSARNGGITLTRGRFAETDTRF